ncbi:MAG: hypothetical protein ACYCYJ_17440 [Trichloromonadaceae bacterium]
MNCGLLFDPLVIFGVLLAIAWGTVAAVGFFHRAPKESSNDDDMPDDIGDDLAPETKDEPFSGTEETAHQNKESYNYINQID